MSHCEEEEFSMKEYQIPEIEVLNLNVVDVITTNEDDENATSWG